MENLIGVFFQCGWPVILLILGWTAGTITERRHLRGLEQRENQLRGLMVVDNRKRIYQPDTVAHAEMVIGQTVVASDYFKSFGTRLRSLIGGEMKLADRLLMRARREALVRAMEQGRAMGATELWNVRFQFTNVGMMRGKRGAMQVEMVAYATAVRRRDV